METQKVILPFFYALFHAGFSSALIPQHYYKIFFLST